MKLVVDKTKCCASGECVKICPTKAITIVEGKAQIDMSKCDLDGICIPACPQRAIDYLDES
ncbi:MAG: ferredoxin [Desulfuromonas sp.]|nr:MAG: ferredoxin [Desulfuromonas sp.]